MLISKRTLYMLSAAAVALVCALAGWTDPAHAIGLAFVGMAFPSDAIDVVDLRALADGGFVREDLYRKVFFLQTVADTPFTNLIGTDECNGDKPEWTFDDVRSPSTSNAAVAGSNPSTYRTATGSRVGTRTQICRGALSVTSTARQAALAGDMDQLMYETDKELKGLRQDVEAIALTHQASVVGDNNATAQKTAGFGAWLKTNTSFGSGGADGGYNTSTHVVDAPTVGVGRALSWALVTTQLLNVYNARGNVRYLMTVPTLIQGINQKIVAGTIKVATPTAQVSGTNPAEQTGQGYFTGVISDFGFMLTFMPNRTQQTYTGGGTSSNVKTCATVYLIDPDYVALAYNEGYKITDLGKVSGLHDDRDITVEWCVKPYREDAHAAIRDIDISAAVTA